jgi:hypothetical protein
VNARPCRKKQADMAGTLQIVSAGTPPTNRSR